MKTWAEDSVFVFWTVSIKEFPELYCSLSIIFCKLYRFSTQHIYLKKVMGNGFCKL